MSFPSGDSEALPLSRAFFFFFLVTHGPHLAREYAPGTNKNCHRLEWTPSMQPLGRHGRNPLIFKVGCFSEALLVSLKIKKKKKC